MCYDVDIIIGYSQDDILDKDEKVIRANGFIYGKKTVAAVPEIIKAYERINKDIISAFKEKDENMRRYRIDFIILMEWPISRHYEWLLDYASEKTRELVKMTKENENGIQFTK